MRHPLTETFGLDTCCFVCDQGNASGLRILYYWDDEDRAVVATPRFGREHTGAPNLVHGGVIAAMIDDCVAWTAIAAAHHFAMTAELRITYLAPVPVGDEVTVTSRMVGRHKSQIWVIVQVRAGETLAARAEARCTVMGDELRAMAGMSAGAIEQGDGQDNATHPRPPG